MAEITKGDVESKDRGGQRTVPEVPHSKASGRRGEKEQALQKKEGQEESESSTRQNCLGYK